MSRRMRRILLSIVICLFVSAAINTLQVSGAFKTLTPHAPGSCTKIENIVGGEDLTWRTNGRELFVSSTDRRNMNAKQGAILLVEPDAENPQPVNVTPALDFNFQPHGISLWTDDATGKERLFVVNHASMTEHSIEIFDVSDNGQLVHVRTVVDDALISPNDIAAVSLEQFYVTNDHGWRSIAAKLVEDLLRLSLGNVVYYDGTGFREVLQGTRFANGIQTSLDARRIYVAETVGRVVHSLTRDAQTGTLTPEETFFTGTGVDNIDVAPDGSLWIGAHPKLPSFLGHAASDKNRSPSQVLRLMHGADGKLAMSEIYLDNGDPISASATATARDGRLIIGPVFDPFLLVCALNK